MPAHWFRTPVHERLSAQCGAASEFRSLRDFAVCVLFYVDYAIDGKFFLDVVNAATCDRIPPPAFRSIIDYYASIAKRPLPSYLQVAEDAGPLIRVYHGFLETRRATTYPVRLTIVGQNKSRYIAFHSRLAL